MRCEATPDRPVAEAGGFCTKVGKQCYADRAEAKDVIRGMQGRGNRRRNAGRLKVRPGKLAAYKCDHCGWWHVGNDVKRHDDAPRKGTY